MGCGYQTGNRVKGYVPVTLQQEHRELRPKQVTNISSPDQLRAAVPSGAASGLPYTGAMSRDTLSSQGPGTWRGWMILGLGMGLGQSGSTSDWICCFTLPQSAISGAFGGICSLNRIPDCSSDFGCSIPRLEPWLQPQMPRLLPHSPTEASSGSSSSSRT